MQWKEDERKHAKNPKKEEKNTQLMIIDRYSTAIPNENQSEWSKKKVENAYSLYFIVVQTGFFYWPQYIE